MKFKYFDRESSQRPVNLTVQGPMDLGLMLICLLKIIHKEYMIFKGKKEIRLKKKYIINVFFLNQIINVFFITVYSINKYKS